MRARAVWWAVTLSLMSACGSVLGSDAGDELRAVVERDDGVDPRWEAINLRSPVDISVAAGAPPMATVVWVETYDGNLTLGAVGATSGCTEECVRGVEAWATERLASGGLAVAAGRPLCGNCVEADRLSLVVVVEDGRYTDVARDDVATTLGDLDTPYEVMLMLGEPAEVRPDGDGWRVVRHRVVSDCDPFIDEYTMWSIDPQNEREQLARFEQRDNSCA